jgi:hypothetical protein
MVGVLHAWSDQEGDVVLLILALQRLGAGAEDRPCVVVGTRGGCGVVGSCLGRFTRVDAGDERPACFQQAPVDSAAIRLKTNVAIRIPSAPTPVAETLIAAEVLTSRTEKSAVKRSR